MSQLSKLYAKAKDEGRLCKNCKWIIPVAAWKKGHRLCGNCADALRGVNCETGALPYMDEPMDKTGEMP